LGTLGIIFIGIVESNVCFLCFVYINISARWRCCAVTLTVSIWPVKRLVSTN